MRVQRYILMALMAASLLMGGCVMQRLITGRDYSSPRGTVLTFANAKAEALRASCFPPSWPESVRLRKARRLTPGSGCRVLTQTPTTFAGESMLIYGEASTVIEASDVEIRLEIDRPAKDGAELKEHWWFVLRDCDGQWKILAFYKTET